MGTSTIHYRLAEGQRFSIGRSGKHQVIADRPAGKAGGSGAGFNGGELLALSAGGCLCNDLQVLADQQGIEIRELAIRVEVDFDGDPSRAQDMRITIDCKLADGRDPATLIERAQAMTAIGNSLRTGFPVTIAAAA